MRVEFSRFVEGDLDAIAGYIAQDNPTRAVSFIQEIGAQIRRIGQNPLIYQAARNWRRRANGDCGAVCDFISYNGESRSDRTRSLWRP